jgi:aminoglycoside phosphotransferase (APT) family kinase protein
MIHRSRKCALPENEVRPKVNDQLTVRSGARIGQGRTAEVFAWGNDRALKLYHAGWPATAAEAEYQKAEAVYKSGAPAPAVHSVMEVDGRHGVVYGRVDGPSLLNHTTARPWTIFHSARLMAEVHAHMHACRPSGLPVQRGRLHDKIREARPLPEELKQAALMALTQLPDDSVLCHGDFHPDNIVLSTNGPVILDWTEATSGHPLADVARTTLMMRHAAVPAHVPGRHIIEAGRMLWYQLYLRRYCQLTSVSPKQVEAWLLPVAAARLSEGIPEEEEQLMRLIERTAILDGQEI